MRIALDCDETLLFTGQVLSDYYRVSVDANADMPAHIWSSKWTVWNGNKTRWKEWFNTWINSDWYTKMDAFPGALDAVTRLKSAGHKLFVLSAGLHSATDRRRKHLERIFGPVFDDVIVVDNSEEKEKVLRDLKIDVFVDDDIKNLASAAPIPGIAILQIANKHQIDEIKPFPTNVKLANNWDEVIKILEDE